MRKFALMRLLPFVMIVACDNVPSINPVAASKPYPEQIVTNFVKACKGTGGAQIYCECMIEEVQKSIPLEEYNEMEVMLRVNPDAAVKSKAFKQLAAKRLICT